MLQEQDGVLCLASAFIPEEALTLIKIIGTIPVDALRQRRTIAQSPGSSAFGRPGVSQLQVTVEVRLVDIDEPNLLITNLGKVHLELLHESSSFFGIGSLEKLLAFLPTQSVLRQQRA